MFHYHINRVFDYSLLFFYMKTDVKNSKVVITVITCLMLQVKWASCAGYCSPIFSISNVSKDVDHLHLHLQGEGRGAALWQLS